MGGKEELSELKRESLEKRTLAIADKFVHDNTLALTNAMDFYTLANLLRNLDDIEDADLQVLSIYRMDLDFNYAHEVLPILNRFEEAILDDCEGSHVCLVLANILQEKSIQRLTVFSQILDPAVDAAFLSGLKLSTLTELNLTIEMPQETAECLCAGINSSCLEILDLNQCEISEEAIDILCHCFENNNKLKTLKLDHSRLRDNEVAALLRSVRFHPALRELSVRMNYAHEEAIHAARELLETTVCLECLDLAQQNPGVIDLSQLAFGLANNVTLRNLNLQENYLNDFHMPQLVRALSVNTSLSELNLENCELKDAGLSVLINSLGDFPALTHVWLKENNFRQPLNQQALDLALRKNRTIQVLDFDDENWIPDPLKYILFLNRAGRRYLDIGSLPPSLWPTVLARVKGLFDPTTRYSFSESDVLFDMLGPVLLGR